MNFEARKRVAADMLGDFFDRFAPPRGVPEEQLSRISAGIAEAFARKLPVCGEEDYRERIRDAFRVVSDSHKGYTWPSQAEFVEAMQAVGPAGTAAPETFDADATEIGAKRLKAGEPVDDRFVWSGQCLGRAGVTIGILDRYRQASVAAYRSVFRHTAHAVMRDRFGAVVDPYFAEGLHKEA